MCLLPCRGHSFLSNTAVHQAHLEFMFFSDISSENESYLCDYGFKTQQEGYYRPRLFLICLRDANLASLVLTFGAQNIFSVNFVPFWSIINVKVL